MKRIPTKLKQLAERKARLSGELNTCNIMAQPLTHEITKLKARLETAQVLLAASVAKKDRLLIELAEIDLEIINFNPNVNPASIESIKAWKGKYGKRGGLKAFVYQALKSRSPSFVSTSDLSKMAIIEFSLVFESAKIRKNWYDDSLRGALAALLKDGLVEKGALQISSLSGTIGNWRLKQESQPTLAELSARSDAIAAAAH